VLRNNEILALMVDGPNCRKGVKVILGWTQVKIPFGVSVLSLRTGSPIIPCGLVRSSNTTFEAIIGQPIKYKPSGRIKQDVLQLTQWMVFEIENIIRPYADQWYVFHSLFKNEAEKEFLEITDMACQ
jgi:lauroyl/myristoyl acyltransferase